MDVMFENSYIRTKELFKEIYRFIYFKRPVYIFFDILLGLSFLANIVCLIYGYQFNNIPLIIVPLFYSIQFYKYFKAVNVSIKRDNEINPDTPFHVNTIVTKEFFQSATSTGSVNQLKFSQIKKAIQTKNLILLLSQANIIYILKKDAFTKGNHIEFIHFIETIGIQIK